MPWAAFGCYLVYVVAQFGILAYARRHSRLDASADSPPLGKPVSLAGWIYLVVVYAGMGAGPTSAVLWNGLLFRNKAVAVGGVAAALAFVWLIGRAQLAMSGSWRVGINAEAPPLVESGPFAAVRNPIYLGLILLCSTLFLIAPTSLGAVGLAVVVITMEVQVRAVEEPFLREAHGERYRAYAARTGRFVPGVGRMKSGQSGGWRVSS